MTNILFWNIGRNSPVSVLRDICFVHNIEIAILAEDLTPPGVVVRGINHSRVGAPFVEYAPLPVSGSLRFYTSLDVRFFSPVFDSGRVSIRSFQPPGAVPVLITAVHLPSKLHADEEAQYFHARQLRASVERAEASIGHQNSILIGDLNMDPFEKGVVAADGLHGVMDRGVALRRARTFAGEERGFFYNPMWGRLGDDSSGPPGSHYYSSGKLVSNFWHMFDQVLIRPSLIERYDPARLSIITGVSGISFLRNSRLDRSISDHLPVVFGMDLEV